MVVTLEPCSHQGKTPPCVDLIINKKFSKVVIGTLDKNPDVAGKSVKKLENAGIEVLVGLKQKECEYINRAFFKYIIDKKPYVIIKVAQSLDGNIALTNKLSQWITSPGSRNVVQNMRAESDAILVGTNTILEDNPSLLVLEVSLPSPLRIIPDKNLKLPLTKRIFHRQTQYPSVVFHHSDDKEKLDALQNMGVKTEKIGLDSDGYLDLKELLNILGEKYFITSLLVEGGADIYTSFVYHKLIDEMHIFVAPKILGKGLQSFSGLNFKNLNETQELNFINVEQLGPDLHIVSTLKY